MNSGAGNAGTVHPLVRTERGSLQLRALSAVTLAPFPIAAIWFGWPWLPLLTAIAAAVMAWEWGRLCRRGPFWQTRVGLFAGVLPLGAAPALASPPLALATPLLSAGLLFLAAPTKNRPRPRA